MFIFDIDHNPRDAAELTAAITAFLRSWITLPLKFAPVTIVGQPPAVSSMTINVTAGQISPENPPAFAKVSGETEPGPTARSFAITGHPVSVAGIPLQLDLSAANAVFVYGRTSSRKLVATLQEATAGKLSIHIAHDDLEAGALALARQGAGSSVSIQKLDITLSSISPTDLNVLLTITARKFVSAIVRVSGRIHIDTELVLTASNLKADAEGMVGTIAANMLQPHLRALEGKPVPLMTFSLGNVKVRDVTIGTAEGLQINAAFGSERA
jgi:hypothetical protein